MTREELVDRIAEKADISKKAAAIALNTFIESVTTALKKGGRVSLVGFGTFMVRKIAARSGRNPRTGETLHIPARRRPVFKPGKTLRDALQ